MKVIETRIIAYQHANDVGEICLMHTTDNGRFFVQSLSGMIEITDSEANSYYYSMPQTHKP